MPATPLPGLVLLSDDAKRVDLWVQRGVVPSYVVQLSGWTGVVPAGPARAKPPYDDALTVLANMPVPMAMRPALGLFGIGGRAVVVMHTRRWRALPRWLVWEPRTGLVRVNLPQGHVPDLLGVAGVVDEVRGAVSRVLRARDVAAPAVLRELVEALGLPGASLLDGSIPDDDEDIMLVEPHRRAVARFGRVAASERGADS